MAVFRVGGLGRPALQYAKIAGATVVAVDVTDEKLALAEDLGAHYVVNAVGEDPIAAVKALGGAHVAISVAVAPKAFEQAYGSLRRGGRILLVAPPGGQRLGLARLRDGAERHHGNPRHRGHPKDRAEVNECSEEVKKGNVRAPSTSTR